MKGVSGEIELWKGFDVVLKSPAAIAGGELSIASFPPSLSSSKKKKRQ
jgi:hypothetical protein